MSMSRESLKELVGEMVEEKLKEIMGDPDYDLELRDWVKKRLKKFSHTKGRETVSSRHVAKELGLRW
jgi:vacuolar-type H+-ATPase subunit E/Vma4